MRQTISDLLIFRYDFQVRFRNPRALAFVNHIAYAVGVQLMLRNFLTEATEERVGIFAKGGSGGEEIGSADVETNPLFVTITAAAFNVT